MNRTMNILCLLSVLLCVSCTKEPAEGKRPGGSSNAGSQTETLKITPFEQLNAGAAIVNSHENEWQKASLKMDRRSYLELGPENNVNLPTYSRICRLNDGSYILTWQNAIGTNGNGQDTFYATSPDLKNWTYRGYLWRSYSVVNAKGANDTRRFTNANIIQLSDGELLAVAAFSTVNTYGTSETNSLYRPEQGLIIKKSRDKGLMWYGEKEIYHGPCWEAHLMELPSGEIQCFFSESRPSVSGSHSGTVMVYSEDKGNTWYPQIGGDALRVMRKHWWNEYPKSQGRFGSPMYCYTYQMPVGVILNNSNQFAFAMESANARTKKSDDNVSDQFSIAIAFSKPDGKWVYFNEGEVLPREQRIDSVVVRGAAPYLVQFKSGETLLAYGGQDSKQHFKIGNAKATEFGADFNGLPEKGSWGGLSQPHSHSIVSCMRNSRDGAENANISLARYNLNHSITATKRTAKADGDNSEWTNADEALFIGETSQAQATLRCSADESNLYFLMEVLDYNLSASDFGFLMLSPADGSGRLSGKSRRVRFGINGIKNTDKYAGGWTKYAFGVEASIAYSGTIDYKSDEDKGFIIEICIPKSSIEIIDGKVLVNFGYYDAIANSEDSLSKDSSSSASWIEIKGL